MRPIAQLLQSLMHLLGYRHRKQGSRDVGILRLSNKTRPEHPALDMDAHHETTDHARLVVGNMANDARDVVQGNERGIVSDGRGDEIDGA